MKVWKSNPSYKFDISDLSKLITRKTKLLAITASSNVTGAINPIKQIIRAVKEINSHCRVLVDAAQEVPHRSVDVQAWGADFIAFSVHKMLGPTGVGVLWGRQELLESMSPFQYGGDMIREVSIDRTVFKDAPYKFEAGTPHIAGVIGFGTALDYLSCVGMNSVRAHEESILAYAMSQLSRFSGLTIYGSKEIAHRAGIISFTLGAIHPHDIAQILDEDNICIRAGHHCAMPLHQYLGVGATARVSFYLYTSTSDIDVFIQGLEKTQFVLKKT